MPELRPLTPAGRERNASLRVAEIARRQDGVISWSQLVGEGVSRSAITRWVRSGRLHRLHPRVYAVGHPALGLRARLIAALMYGGPGAVLSHTTAGWWWKLIPAQPSRIHVTVSGRRKSVADVCVHRARHLDATRHNALPITTIPRTLLDLAAMLPFDDVRRALAEADYHGLLDVSAVADVLGRGRPGSRALRDALEIHLPELAETRSVLEAELLPLCESARLPVPELNQRVHGHMVDALWRQQRVIVELDGGAGHGSIARMRADRARDLDLRELGYVVLRYSATQVRREPERVAAEVRRNLQARHP